VAELALDDVQGNTLTCEFERVGVAQLMRCEAAPDAGLHSEAAKLDAHAGA
jgi:hypothetical protein